MADHKSAMSNRISMIALGVQDLARAQAFYEQGLGLPRMEGPPGVVFFNLNGTWLGLSPWHDLASDIGTPPEGAGFRGVTLAHNVADEGSVDRILAQAVAAGASLVKPARRADWGGYHGYFSDPDGHLWEIAYNPFFWIGPKDC